MGLESTFYIVGLVFMGLMMLMLLALLAVVLVIKAKINKVHNMVYEKINQVKNAGDKVSMAIKICKNLCKRQYHR